MNAPVADRIPLPPLSECLRQERLRAMKDSHKMCVIGQDQPPRYPLINILLLSSPFLIYITKSTLWLLRLLICCWRLRVIRSCFVLSVCFYTTLNGHGGVSSCDVSEDSSYLALGYLYFYLFFFIDGRPRILLDFILTQNNADSVTREYQYSPWMKIRKWGKWRELTTWIRWIFFWFTYISSIFTMRIIWFQVDNLVFSWIQNQTI